MPIPTASEMARQAIQEVVDLVAVDGLPDDKHERRETLRLLAQSDSWVPTHCPETGRALDGIDIVAHAQRVYPPNIPARSMSPQAQEREAALYRAAGVKPPSRS
jgi:hypothetical protein